jgi:hydroxylamine reductase
LIQGKELTIMNMFCNQCEQTARGTGCDVMGVCGKDPAVAALQDLIVHQLKGIGWLAHQARRSGRKDDGIDRYAIEALFSTVTNVNFDADRLIAILRRGEEVRRKAIALAGQTGTSTNPPSTAFVPVDSLDGMLEQAAVVRETRLKEHADIRSLKEILLYGVKGLAAYADHALLLGERDDAIFAFIHEALANLNDQSILAERLTGLCLQCGSVAIRCMEILDKAHTGRFGHPQPSAVSTGTKKGPAIIISGHDLYDLEELLKQTEGTGVNVYTHGEMLPAHGYPGLKKYAHLAGHFGTAWQNQQREFDNVPAAVLFTTNCIQKPRDSYKDRVFTAGLVAWPGATHIMNRDFGPVIQKAKELGGFAEKTGGTLLTGCGRNAVLSLAGTVVEAVKTGAIKRFFVIGGCDGAKPGRNYYTTLAESIPRDCVIITLACGKFRFNDRDFGTIGGIPRLLDAGQCNDAYSVIAIASALANAFNCTIHDLPVSIVLSWYEQKAVTVLLALLSLKLKGIRIGPSLPAFISPAVLDILVKEFDIKPVTTPENDLAMMLGNGK